jgi:phosphoglycerol transferase MdoB-like AlkP superfamily enzyme
VESDPNGVRPVNILCIMDESFGDLSIFEHMNTDTDVLPFYHSMKENTIKGWMYPPVTGGGTATTEYDFITGNSVSFLPLGTVAYQLYVKAGMPSLFSWARGNGFQTTAFHPYKASGWNRVEVYNDFGADTQLYDEDVKAPEYVRSYISDRCDFRVLEDITSAEENDRQFIFNVTMQNHGGYKQGWRNLSPAVQLAGPLEGVSEYANQYIALMHETDAAIEELLDYYEEQDEPTLIVFFGDHQGSLSDWFYEKLYGKELEDRDIAEVEHQFAVPFFIWANYDIPEAQDVMISANYLGALMTQVSNYPTTPYYNYLSQLYADLPVINRTGYITALGEVVENREDLSEELQAKLHEYQTLCYYNLFHRDSDLDQMFFLPNTGETP